MKLCKRCAGSGWLFRPKPKLPIKDSYKQCTNCGGHGIKPAHGRTCILSRKSKPSL